MRATSGAHSGESTAAAARHVQTRFMRATVLCVWAAKAAQMAAVASQAAAAASASGIATGESGTIDIHSAAAALALMEAVHAQLVAAFSKEMADADGEMLAEYGAMDAMEPLPQETVGRELNMEAAAKIDEHQP